MWKRKHSNEEKKPPNRVKQMFIYFCPHKIFKEKKKRAQCMPMYYYLLHRHTNTDASISPLRASVCVEMSNAQCTSIRESQLLSFSSRSARPIWHMASRCRHSAALVYVCHATHAQTASCRSVLIRLCVCWCRRRFVCLRRCLPALCIVCLGSRACISHTILSLWRNICICNLIIEKLFDVESTGAIRKRADTDENFDRVRMRLSRSLFGSLCVCVNMRNQRESKYYSNKVCCTSAPSCCCSAVFIFFRLRCRRLVSRFVSLERQLIDVDDYTMAMRAREFYVHAMKRPREWKKNIMMKNV